MLFPPPLLSQDIPPPPPPPAATSPMQPTLTDRSSNSRARRPEFDDGPLHQHITSMRDVYIDRFRELIAIPSVSPESSHWKDVRQAQLWIKSWCEKLGGSARLEEPSYDSPDNPAPPTLLAQFGDDPRKKTLLVYTHVDVHATYRDERWLSNPFELVEREGALYGVGTSDNKGPLTAWLWAVEAYNNLGEPLPINLKVVSDGSEKGGVFSFFGEIFNRLLKKKDFFDPDAIDWVLISDGVWTGKVRPCLTHGLRGVCYFHVEVESSTKDVQASAFGGSVHEACTDVVRIMASLADAAGNILVDGIYDNIPPETEAEVETVRDAEFDPEAFKQVYGIAAVTDTLVHSTKEALLLHLWRYPALSLHGIEFTVKKSMSQMRMRIPGKAIGKFSIRLVPGMDVEKVERLVQEHVSRERQALGSPNRVNVEMTYATPAWYREPSEDIFQAASGATYRVHQQTVSFQRTGASIPMASILEEYCQAPCIIFPICTVDSCSMGQNENISVDSYISGVKVFATFMDELACIDSDRNPLE